MRLLRFMLAAVAFVTAGAASAAVPDPSKSTVPSYIRIVGTQAGVPDPTAAFTVTYRDFTNTPVAGATIRVDFTNCSDLTLCSVQGQATLDCANKSVSATTDASGQVRIFVLGAAGITGNLSPPAIALGAGADCARIYANEVQLGTSTAIICDLNGTTATGNGVSPLDLALAKNEVGAVGLGAPYRGRCDYSADGGISSVDLAFLMRVVGLAGLGQGSHDGCATSSGPAAYCP